jgi:hypothetical protein
MNSWIYGIRRDVLDALVIKSRQQSDGDKCAVVAVEWHLMLGLALRE